MKEGTGSGLNRYIHPPSYLPKTLHVFPLPACDTPLLTTYHHRWRLLELLPIVVHATLQSLLPITTHCSQNSEAHDSDLSFALLKWTCTAAMLAPTVQGQPERGHAIYNKITFEIRHRVNCMRCYKINQM